MSKRLIYVAGPTAVGKTALSVALAQHYQTEIISCDARQVYREMTLGTAVPTPEEQQGVPHHFIQHRSIHSPYGAGDFEKEGLELLKRLFQKHDLVVMVGGSGLYAKALVEGLDDFPAVNQTAINIVSQLYKRSGIAGLQKALEEKDPDYYAVVDRQNPSRLIRALEVCETADTPYSSFLRKTVKERFFKTQTFCLTRPRAALYDRINQRVDQMVAMGLQAEAQSLFPHRKLPALQTVGYQEWFSHFEGKTTAEHAIAEIKKNTRRYAKRQLTWLKKEVTVAVDLNRGTPPLPLFVKEIG